MKPIASSPERSRLLGRVRQRGTSAELAVGRVLRGLGLSYRKNVRSLPGTPDFANRKGRWAVLVQGCFWHHHKGCRRATVPKANRAFWLEKFSRNRSRDAVSARELRRMGFTTVFVWECQIPEAASRLAKLARVALRATATRELQGGVPVESDNSDLL